MQEDQTGSGGIGFTLFDTALGRCGMAWGSRGIVAVQLPEADDNASRARLLSRHPAALQGPPPPAVQAAMDRVAGLMRGEPCDFSDVALDMAGVPDFHRRVYALALAIPFGRTRSYGEIAAALGQPGAARAVGRALGHNPFAPIVPCHRVLAARQGAGGFSARGGVQTKLRLLLLENAVFGAPGLFDSPAPAV